MNWPFIIISTCCALLLIRMITTVVHEIGHAIAARLLTKDKVSMYIGSYGDHEKSRRIALGKFELWINTNPLKWSGGMCRHSACSDRENFIITLAGPMASLLLFIIVTSVYVLRQPEGLTGAFLFIFCAWSGLTFLYNIVPTGKTIDLSGGNMMCNDGTVLRMLRLNKKMPVDYHLAMEHFEAKRYAEAATLLDNILEQGTKNEFVYRTAITAHIELKNYRKADAIQKEQVAKIGNLNAEDRVNMALLKTYLGKYDEAINYYKHLLQTGGANKYNLNNLGYTLTLLDRCEEAIPYLDMAISIDADFAFAYSNRGYAHLRMGAPELGKADTDRSLALDPDNACAYRNEGIYLFEKGLYSEALAQLSKAKAMDSDTPLVDQYIDRTKNWLEF